MPLPRIAALTEASSSDAITSFLGVVAVAALLAAGAFSVAIHLADVARGPKQAKGPVSGSEGRLAAQAKALMAFDDGFASERDRLNRELAEFYEATLMQMRRKLGGLTERAAASFKQLAEAYARRSVGAAGEDRAARAVRYRAVCERQWGFFKAELGYLSFSQVQENLRHILESYRLLDVHCTRRDEAEEMSPEALRSQEVVSLARAVIRKDLDPLQDEFAKVIEPFSDYYDRQVKEWLNDRLFKVMAKLRHRSPKGVTVSETDLKEDLRALRVRFEVVARLAERVGQNAQKMNEEGLALGQLVFVGTVLSMLAELETWFPEIAQREGEGDSAAAIGRAIAAKST